jgi:hypothetical protein
MSIGIEVEKLSKVYTSPPAVAARPGGFGMRQFRKKAAA